MGKSFISLIQNGASQNQIIDTFNRLKKKEVIEASFEKYFKKDLPSEDQIDEINIGVDGTKESVVYFKDGTFVVFNGVVRQATIISNWVK